MKNLWLYDKCNGKEMKKCTNWWMVVTLAPKKKDLRDNNCGDIMLHIVAVRACAYTPQGICFKYITVIVVSFFLRTQKISMKNRQKFHSRQ